MNELMHQATASLPHLVDYLVYACIAVVTAIGVVKCLLPLWNTTHALRRAIRKLQDQAGENPERPVWQEPKFMGKRLKGCWLRFLQNAEQLDRRGLPCNVEDYINDDTVTHGPGNATLAEMIPNLLTSLGILGTFIGMTQGLSGLDVSSTDSMMSGIQTLLNGMQFAFGTSVAGVSCSLIFNMLNRIAQGSSYRAIDDFTESFTQLAMQRPLDNDVQLICQNQDRNHLLGTVTEQVSTRMASSIEGAIGRAMQPVSQSMDRFLMGATQTQIDGVQHIVNRFVEQMNSSLNGQFLTLGKTMTDINRNQQVSMERLEQSMNAVSGIIQDTRQLHTVSGEVIDRFEQYVSEMSQARQRDERFEKTSAELLAAMHQAADQQGKMLARLQQGQENLGHALNDFQAAGARTLDQLQQNNTDATRSLRSVSQTMQDAGQQLAGSYQRFVSDVVDGLSRSLGMFEASMNDMTDAFAKKLEAAGSQSAVSSVTEEMAGMQKALGGMQTAIEQATAALQAVREEA